jgi:hypothetical protein
MKPLVIAFSLIFIVLWGRLAQAQGTVTFQNFVLPSPPDRLVRDSSGQPLVGTNFVAQLLYETTTDSFTPHPDIATFGIETTPLPGTWAGGSRTLTGAGGPYIPLRMQVRVWDRGFGAVPLSFDEAISDGRQWGSSEIFTYIEMLSDPPSPRDRYMWEFRGFQLIPEPSTWALLVLGGGWLVWRWRRNR